MVQADPVAVERAARVCASRRPIEHPAPERYQIVSPRSPFNLADPVEAERREQVAVERQAALDRRDDEVDVVKRVAVHVCNRHVPRARRSSCRIERSWSLFHYHLVTSDVRDVEARYLGKLGFRLIARYGRIGEDQVHFEAGVSWEELEQKGFRHRLSELERGAVNVVVQPGQWPLPRVDHLGVALDDDEFHEVLERATEAPTARAGVPRPADVRRHRRRLPARGAPAARLDRRAARERRRAAPGGAAPARRRPRRRRPRRSAELLELERSDGDVVVGGATVRFLPGGPARPAGAARRGARVGRRQPVSSRNPLLDSRS